MTEQEQGLCQKSRYKLEVISCTQKKRQVAEGIHTAPHNLPPWLLVLACSLKRVARSSLTKSGVIIDRTRPNHGQRLIGRASR